MPSKSNPSLVEQNHLYNSMEITLKVPVLHLDTRSDTYRKVLEDTVVGCMCIFT